MLGEVLLDLDDGLCRSRASRSLYRSFCWMPCVLLPEHDFTLVSGYGTQRRLSTNIDAFRSEDQRSRRLLLERPSVINARMLMLGWR
jgi:hypothetical protein